MRGANLDQDVRFTDKEALALEKIGDGRDGVYARRVDMTRVDLAAVRAWLAKAVVRELSREDEVAVDTCVAALEEGRFPDGRKVQIVMSAFWGERAGDVTAELWLMLLKMAAEQGMGNGKGGLVAAFDAEGVAGRVQGDEDAEREEVGMGLDPGLGVAIEVSAVKTGKGCVNGEKIDAGGMRHHENDRLSLGQKRHRRRSSRSRSPQRSPSEERERSERREKRRRRRGSRTPESDVRPYDERERIERRERREKRRRSRSRSPERSPSEERERRERREKRRRRRSWSRSPERSPSEERYRRERRERRHRRRERSQSPERSPSEERERRERKEQRRERRKKREEERQRRREASLERNGEGAKLGSGKVDAENYERDVYFDSRDHSDIERRRSRHRRHEHRYNDYDERRERWSSRRDRYDERSDEDRNMLEDRRPSRIRQWSPERTDAYEHKSPYARGVRDSRHHESRRRRDGIRMVGSPHRQPNGEYNGARHGHARDSGIHGQGRVDDSAFEAKEANGAAPEQRGTDNRRGSERWWGWRGRRSIGGGNLNGYGDVHRQSLGQRRSGDHAQQGGNRDELTPGDAAKPVSALTVGCGATGDGAGASTSQDLKSKLTALKRSHLRAKVLASLSRKDDHSASAKES